MIRRLRPFIPAALVLAFIAPPLPNSASPASSEQRTSPPATPDPSALVERAEVRFVTLDLVVEEHVRGGWRRARNLTADQVRVKVGGKPVELELFENGCGRKDSPAPAGKGAPVTTAGPAGAPASAAEGEFPASETGPRKYVLYFDLEHLSFGSRSEGFKAALEWAEGEVTTQDQVMIVSAGISLRVVRPMLPASLDLVEDLEAARRDFGGEDLWGAGEDLRREEIRHAGPAAPSLRKAYAGIDRSVSTRVMQNFRDLMALLGGIPGTKNLIFVSEKLRLIPGSEYFGQSNANAASLPSGLRGQLFDIYTQVAEAAAAANEKNVRIYTLYAGGLGGTTTDPLVMLASETGGQEVHGTNRLGMVFERVEEDLACAYRIGFRISVGHTGKVLPITVVVGSEGRGYRVRHRRSITDPTREEQETELLLTAFLAPASARSFPLTLRVIRLFDGPLGTRARIEAEVSLADLLALPVSAAGHKASVIIGGKVVALREEAAASASGAQDPWFGTDPRRATLAFDRRADFTIPAGAGNGGSRRVVYTGEIDLPPGAYRFIAVAEDRQARSAAARVLDFVSRRGEGNLGEIGLMVRDPGMIAIAQPAPDRAEEPPSPRKQPEARLAASSVPPEMVALDEAASPDGRNFGLVYGVCDSPPLSPEKEKGPAPERFQGWQLVREVRCGGATTATLPPRTIPNPPAHDSCTVVVDPLPGSEVGDGDCHVEVRLERPGAPAEVRARDFNLNRSEN